MSATSDPAEQVWISIPQICKRLGVSAKWLYRRRQDDPTFPKPAYFHGVQKPYFLLEELKAWERSCIVASRGEAAA